MFRFCVFTAAAVLAANGFLHGLWAHRWEGWAAPAAQAAAARVERLPLAVGEWEGKRIQADAHDLPEEDVGRGITVQYTSRRDGGTATVFLTCGLTDGLVSHTPRVCYPANGFTCPTADLRVPVSPAEGRGGEFWVSNYSKTDPVAPTHLRVYWAWSDGSGWQIPNNPRRTFRATPVIYKCYVVRRVTSPEEHFDGDPGMQLLTDLLPHLDPLLTPGP